MTKHSFKDNKRKRSLFYVTKDGCLGMWVNLFKFVAKEEEAVLYLKEIRSI